MQLAPFRKKHRSFSIYSTIAVLRLRRGYVYRFSHFSRALIFTSLAVSGSTAHKRDGTHRVFYVFPLAASTVCRCLWPAEYFPTTIGWITNARHETRFSQLLIRRFPRFALPPIAETRLQNGETFRRRQFTVFAIDNACDYDKRLNHIRGRNAAIGVGSRFCPCLLAYRFARRHQ